MRRRVRAGRLGLGLGFLASMAVAVAPRTARALSDDYSIVERGRVLATAADCIACHTVPGGRPYAGGRDLQTPFGTILTPNITPDVATGIGGWTQDDFYRALHEGLRPGGVHLYPAFPYPSYTKLTRDDSDALFAFLQRLQPQTNAVNRNTLAFPFSIRSAMSGWNAFYFTPGTFRPDPARSAEFNRGAYLAEALGHCGVCHTPMNWFGANDADRTYQGNVIDGWAAPAISNDTRTGIGGWSADEIVQYLHTGHNAYAAASGPMAEVVSYSTAAMPVADLHAIAVYLKEHGGRAGPAAAPAASVLSGDDTRIRSGGAIYADTCKACHGPKGEGIANLFPRLAGAPAVQQADPTTLVRVVIQGGRSAATAHELTAPAMPSLGWRLTDEQVADVLTYVRNSWGNQADPVNASDVSGVSNRFQLRAAR